MFSKILLVLDGSEKSELAIPYAEKLAKAFNSRLLLLYLKKLGHDNSIHLSLVSDKIASTLGQTKLKTARAIGDPANAVINYVTQNGIDLVVMADSCGAKLVRWPTGVIPWVQSYFLPARIIKAIRIPLLSIRFDTFRRDQIKNIDRILAPLDGTLAGQAALPYAAGLARRLGAELILFQALKSRKAPAQNKIANSSMTQNYPKDSISEAKMYLATIQESLLGLKRIHTEVRIGAPRREIFRYVDEAGIDIVALPITRESPRVTFFGDRPNQVSILGIRSRT